jgi:N6-adenosine-specific RNA methylase IME4
MPGIESWLMKGAGPRDFSTKIFIPIVRRVVVQSHHIAGKESGMIQLPGLTGRFATILADPPWRFQNRTGKVAPEHVRLRRYETMSVDEICDLPVVTHTQDRAHLYLWVPNALLPYGLQVMKAWGFTYKTNLVWFKVRKDGGPDGRGVGFYFRNVTELLLFGIRGKIRTLQPGRRQVNLFASRKREHSRKPSSIYKLIKECSPGPHLELFAREPVKGWTQWGDELETYQATRKAHPAYDCDESTAYAFGS